MRLLVEERSCKDDFTSFLDNSKIEFNLTYSPAENTLIISWNGIILKEGIDNDFVLIGKKIKTNFVPYKGNTLEARYKKV